MPHPHGDETLRDGHERRLLALEERLKSDLMYLGYPGNPWVPETQRHDGVAVCDVVIVGGGMCGLLVLFALAMQGVRNVRIIDRNPEGFEGPWLTFARMETLRSPKHLTGPAFGIGSLTFQAWHRAKFGDAAWDDLNKAPRAMWMDYLRWYRAVLAVPVENGVELKCVRPEGALLRLTVDGAGEETILARRLVHATGREGSGRPTIPDFAGDLPRQLWAHSADPIDFAGLRGKDVAVVGAGASAVENAAEALEAGANEVRLIIRRNDLPTVNKMMGIGSGGFTNGFAGLDDEWRWRILHYAFTMQTPPPRGSMLRVKRHSNGYFHFGQAIRNITTDKGRLQIALHGGMMLAADFLILGTGFSIDPSTHSELGAAAGNILQWCDIYQPPADEENAELGRFPYLGDTFEFCEKRPGETPWINRIYCFNYAATASLGKVSGDIPGVSEGAAWLARGISASLYAEDIEQHWQNLQDYAKPELLGDEWVASKLDDDVE